MLTASAAGAKRVLDRLDRIYAIGGGEGANRPGLSAAEQDACELVAGWMREADLEPVWDGNGNLIGRLAGTSPELDEVWTGSHLDSVPSGGRFDGVLGVVAGLEAAERIGAQPRTLAVVVFRDEEGWRFRRGCVGSRGLCGLLAEDDLEARDERGVSLREARAALALGDRTGEVAAPGVFVEAHVEQGPVLAAAEAPLGVVTGIVGTARGEVEFRGTPGHAGTTPMHVRKDPLCAAAEVVLRVRDAARAIRGTVATVGQLVVEPGAANVVPGRAWLTIDARAPDRRRLDALVDAIGVELRATDPVSMDEAATSVLREEVARLGLPVVELPSGAGHDAGVLAAAGIPTAMLFVRSLADGASHSPAEESSADDVALCVDVLEATLRRLARA